MHSTAPDNNDSPRTAGRRAVGMPRQYGIRTMLVITTLYAAFFALLGCLEAPPAAFVLPGVFLAGIGLGQMLLFQGKRPREASLLVGSCSFVVAAAVGVVISHVAGERGDGVLLWMVVFTPAPGRRAGLPGRRRHRRPVPAGRVA